MQGLGWPCVVVAGVLLTAGCTSWLSPQSMRDPLTVDEHLQLGAVYQHQGQWEPASREYHSALQQQPEHGPALMALGNLAFEQSHWAEAADAFQRVLDREPHHAAAANNLAMVLLATDTRLDEAEQLARRAREQPGPLRPYILETLASLYVRQGRFTEARQAVEEGIAAGAQHPALQARFEELRQHIAARDTQSAGIGVPDQASGGW
jgi:Tfp pilus assembly protein PilF